MNKEKWEQLNFSGDLPFWRCKNTPSLEWILTEKEKIQEKKKHLRTLAAINLFDLMIDRHNEAESWHLKRDLFNREQSIVEACQALMIALGD